jgi:hypothetical protein
MSCQDGMKRLKMTRFEEKDLAGFISQTLIKNGQNRKKSLLGADVSGERVFLRASGNNFVNNSGFRKDEEVNPGDPNGPYKMNHRLST